MKMFLVQLSIFKCVNLYLLIIAAVLSINILDNELARMCVMCIFVLFLLGFFFQTFHVILIKGKCLGL